MKLWIIIIAILAVSAPAFAQLGGIGRRVQQAQERKQQFDDLNITEEEEIKLGARCQREDPPALRRRAGRGGAQVRHARRHDADRADDAAPKLPWTFIVLDTDGVNAFAAPGGFVHITRGALALIKSEAELAGVLGHEIAHVAQKHTVNAIRKSKGVQIGTSETSSNRGAFLGALANRAYDMVLENSFDRGDELDADKEGILLVQKAGYAGTGLSEFLARLAERNKAQAEKNGLFASHPETQERIAQGEAARRIEAWRRRCRALHVDHQVSADRSDQRRDRRRRVCRTDRRRKPPPPRSPKTKRQKRRRRALA